MNRCLDQAPQSNLGAGGACSFLPLAFFSGIASLGSRGARLAGSLVGLTSEGALVVVVVEPAVAAWLAVPRFCGSSPRLERLGRLAPVASVRAAERSRVRSEESQ
jgi:hypothetical protein